MDYAAHVLLAAAVLVAVPGWRLRPPPLHAVTVGQLVLLGAAAAVAALGDLDIPTGDPGTALSLTLAALLAVLGGGSVTASVFALVDGNTSADAEGSVRHAGEVLRGGAWIGALERAAVFVTLLAGWPEGAAVTLALKGLGRYPELRTETPGAAERFIIGTFTSVLWAVACAGVAWLMIEG
jgi:hypothetical protein